MPGGRASDYARRLALPSPGQVLQVVLPDNMYGKSHQHAVRCLDRPETTPPVDAMTHKANPVIRGGVVCGTWVRRDHELVVTWNAYQPPTELTIEREVRRVSNAFGQDLQRRLVRSPSLGATVVREADSGRHAYGASIVVAIADSTPSWSRNPNASRRPRRQNGSTTIYFSPERPDGITDGKWVQTVRAKGWFQILRLYSPLPSFFEGTWRAGEVDAVD